MKPVFNYDNYRAFKCCEKIASQRNERKSNIEYYVNENQRTIVAVLRHSQYDVIKALDNMGLLFIYEKDFNIDKCMLSDRYVGKAICHIDDEWDESIGKEIAKNKALSKYYEDRVKIYNYLCKKFEKVYNELCARAQHSEIRLNKFVN